MTQSSIKKIYHQSKFNLGFKRNLEKYFGFETFLKNQYNKSKFFFDNKIIYPVFAKISHYLYQQVIDYYGADYRWNDQKSQNIDKKTNNYGYGLFHYSMIRNQKPKRVLCIGSMYGYIPYMMAKACQDNNFGSIDFVDANYNLKDDENNQNHYFGEGFWNKDRVANHFNYLLNQKFINTYVMRTDQFAHKYSSRKYDYVCLDGDHSYKGVKTDFKLFWPKIKKNGFLCLHDIDLVVDPKNPDFMNLEFNYKKFWEELVAKKSFQYKFEISNQYSGLGFIQKK